MRSPHEAVFEAVEPATDVASPDEFARVQATTYHGTGTRTGKQWTVTVHDLPGGLVKAQGATWRDAQINALTCVVDLLQAAPGTVCLAVTPDDPQAAAALDAVTAARVARAEAEQAERDAVRRAAQILTGQGWTYRDAGTALGLSHQRIGQILADA
ncbi:hypothetical protein [Microbispora bryophytorum]|uniref:Uncharacterized protein n=1 Tax=Microbispora bryophytorum TaxID=1460882 RepID=A0A8H9GYP2_9ACTN|nr:hypothetical protein [Microbispora bryophytorum]MBD3135704.1 hypothetical protein [Microbispora bryophytorum]TQS09869.1 hypothetical protein FLX07_02075 [Microbispora bryophytorum]GGN99028.1 hypothetical protein GCM10011574_04220 [Microbispora bryophytorum]